GEISKTITIPINSDTIPEPDESFFVVLSDPTGAVILKGVGTGTIINDDVPPPTLSINNVSVTEGNSGTTNATFTVTLSAASSQPVTVNYATANGTSIAPGDYQAMSGTLTFNPNQTTKTI